MDYAAGGEGAAGRDGEFAGVAAAEGCFAVVAHSFLWGEGRGRSGVLFFPFRCVCTVCVAWVEKGGGRGLFRGLGKGSLEYVSCWELGLGNEWRIWRMVKHLSLRYPYILSGLTQRLSPSCL